VTNSLTTGISGVVLQAAGAALAFALQLTLARVLGAAEYGSYSYYFTVATIIAIWSRIGSDLMVMKVGGEYERDNRRLLQAVVWHGRRTALAGSILGGLETDRRDAPYWPGASHCASCRGTCVNCHGYRAGRSVHVYRISDGADAPTLTGR
jgi:Zn-dependent protease